MSNTLEFLEKVNTDIYKNLESSYIYLIRVQKRRRMIASSDEEVEKIFYEYAGNLLKEKDVYDVCDLDYYKLTSCLYCLRYDIYYKLKEYGTREETDKIIEEFIEDLKENDKYITSVSIEEC